MKRILSVVILLMLLASALAACSSPSQSEPPADAIVVTALPMVDNQLPAGEIQPGSVVVASPVGASQAVEVLMEIYGIRAEDINVVDVQSVVFSDSCLDARQGQEPCTAGEYPGYIVTLDANNLRHVMHATDSGSVVRVVNVEAAP